MRHILWEGTALPYVPPLYKPKCAACCCWYISWLGQTHWVKPKIFFHKWNRIQRMNVMCMNQLCSAGQLLKLIQDNCLALWLFCQMTSKTNQWRFYEFWFHEKCKQKHIETVFLDQNLWKTKMLKWWIFKKNNNRILHRNSLCCSHVRTCLLYKLQLYCMAHSSSSHRQLARA